MAEIRVDLTNRVGSMKSLHPISFMVDGVITCLLLYGNIAGFFHSVSCMYYVCHFDMANANIRRHLIKTVLWRACATFRQVGVALGIHHTVITRARERYQVHGTPARRHAGGRQRVTTLRIGFRQPPLFEMTLLMLRRSVSFPVWTFIFNDIIMQIHVYDIVWRLDILIIEKIVWHSLNLGHL